MPSARMAHLRDIDTDVWRRATWLLPVAIQPVLALFVGITSLLTDRLLGPHLGFRPIVLLAAAITTALSVAFGALVAVSGSARRRAFGLSIIGSGSAVMVGATTYALFLMLPSDAAA